MSTSSDPRPVPALAVTLVSGSDPDACAGLAATLSGVPAANPQREFELPGATAAEFAVELAEDLVADARTGMTGDLIVVLEAAADVVEVALVLEHALDSQQPRLPIGIREVIAVTTVREILELLVRPEDTPSSDTP